MNFAPAIMRRPVLLAGALALLAGPAPAATLRPFGTLSGPTVAISDLWDDAGAGAATVLGPAPGPGEHIVVEAAQLAAIARQFGVDWTPANAAARSILERPGVLLPSALVTTSLRAWLAASGAPDGAVELTGFVAPLVAPDAQAQVTVERCAWDPAAGRFDATLIVTGRAMAPLRAQVSGRVLAVTAALVARRALPAGAVLAAADLAPAQIARERLRGAPAVTLASVAGLMLRRPLAEGEPLLLAETAPPPLVGRGDRVAIAIAAAGVTVSASGEALQAGALGDSVAVRNPASRAILLATVVGPGQVRLEPGSQPIRAVAAGRTPP